MITPKGKNGEVDVTVKLAGYNQKVLDAAKITNPVRHYIISCLLQLVHSEILAYKKSMPIGTSFANVECISSRHITP